MYIVLYSYTTTLSTYTSDRKSIASKENLRAQSCHMDGLKFLIHIWPYDEESFYIHYHGDNLP
jgi:hypothetical protein